MRKLILRGDEQRAGYWAAAEGNRLMFLLDLLRQPSITRVMPDGTIVTAAKGVRFRTSRNDEMGASIETLYVTAPPPRPAPVAPPTANTAGSVPTADLIVFYKNAGMVFVAFVNYAGIEAQLNGKQVGIAGLRVDYVWPGVDASFTAWENYTHGYPFTYVQKKFTLNDGSTPIYLVEIPMKVENGCLFDPGSGWRTGYAAANFYVYAPAGGAFTPLPAGETFSLPDVVEALSGGYVVLLNENAPAYTYDYFTYDGALHPANSIHSDEIVYPGWFFTQQRLLFPYPLSPERIYGVQQADAGGASSGHSTWTIETPYFTLSDAALRAMFPDNLDAGGYLADAYIDGIGHLDDGGGNVIQVFQVGSGTGQVPYYYWTSAVHPDGVDVGDALANLLGLGGKGDILWMMLGEGIENDPYYAKAQAFD